MTLQEAKDALESAALKLPGWALECPEWPEWATEVSLDLGNPLAADDSVEFTRRFPVTHLPDTVVQTYDFVHAGGKQRDRGVYIDSNSDCHLTMEQAYALHLALGEAVQILTQAGGTIAPEVTR